MRYVAFFRNVNLGQGKSPARAELEAAFSESGGGSSQSFQTNGTVVFSAGRDDAAVAIANRAALVLNALTGLSEPAFVAPLGHLAELVAADPFAGLLSPNAFDPSATFMSPDSIARLSAPLASPRGDIEVIRVTPYVALTVRRQVAQAQAQATPLHSSKSCCLRKSPPGAGAPLLGWSRNTSRSEPAGLGAMARAAAVLG